MQIETDSSSSMRPPVGDGPGEFCLGPGGGELKRWLLLLLVLDTSPLRWLSPSSSPGEEERFSNQGMGDSRGDCSADDEEAEDREWLEDWEEREAERDLREWVVSPPRGWVMEGCKLAEGRVTKLS